MATMLAEYQQRRDRLSKWLAADARIRCVKPAGAFCICSRMSGSG